NDGGVEDEAALPEDQGGEGQKAARQDHGNNVAGTLRVPSATARGACLLPSSSGGTGDAAAQVAAVGRGGIVQIQLRRLDARAATIVAIHHRVEDTAGQEG